MNSNVAGSIWRFFLVVFLQVMVFMRIAPEDNIFYYTSIVIYPIFLFFLPMRVPHTLLILLGFVLGITIDFFYNSLGVHASASVVTAFIRPYLIGAMEPRNGYAINQRPNRYDMGIGWFMTYAGILLFIHLFVYFSVEAFTFVYIGDIILRTLSSFIASMFFVVTYIYILNPK